MGGQSTIAVIQSYLNTITDASPAEPAVRALLYRAVCRLRQLCTRYAPQMPQPLLNLQTDEALGAVVDRLLEAMRAARPKTVRQFFALAGQQTRSELNALVRQFGGADDPARQTGLADNVRPTELADQCVIVEADDKKLPAAADRDSGAKPEGPQILEAIGSLPSREREVFDLVSCQGVAPTEAAELLGVSVNSVKRRLDRALHRLAKTLADLRRPSLDAGATELDPGARARS
jgi:RNA polymerase sigma factor (sigma-70 family)